MTSLVALEILGMEQTFHKEFSQNSFVEIVQINSEPKKNGIDSVRYYDVYDYYNKQLAWEVNYSNGLKDGISKGWYIDGTPKWIVNYNNGRKEGDDKRYYESGKLKSVANYIDGLKQGEEKNQWEIYGAACL